MERIITCETIRSFAYINENVVKMPIRGIVLQFTGLGNQQRYANETLEGEYYGKEGLLYVIPYNNPWCWMNRQAVDFVDEIIDVLVEKYNLGEDVNIISTGGSMGGQGALAYCAYAKRAPIACVTNCPVCDVPYHFTERDDLPRTLYSAVYGFDGTLEEGLKSLSPLHLVNKMPKIPYSIFHCENDNAVNLGMHSEKFVAAMKEAGHDISLTRVANRGHCDLTLDAKREYAKRILDAIK